MPLSPALVGWLIAKGHDAVHAVQLDMHLASDELIMERAEREGRVVITADLDFPRMLAFTEAEGPGLILFRGGDFSERESVERLGKVLEILAETELRTSIVVIERDKIRKRALPIQRT